MYKCLGCGGDISLIHFFSLGWYSILLCYAQIFDTGLPIVAAYSAHLGVFALLRRVFHYKTYTHCVYVRVHACATVKVFGCVLYDCKNTLLHTVLGSVYICPQFVIIPLPVVSSRYTATHCCWLEAATSSLAIGIEVVHLTNYGLEIRPHMRRLLVILYKNLHSSDFQ